MRPNLNQMDKMLELRLNAIKNRDQEVQALTDLLNEAKEVVNRLRANLIDFCPLQKGDIFVYRDDLLIFKRIDGVTYDREVKVVACKQLNSREEHSYISIEELITIAPLGNILTLTIKPGEQNLL